ncbi:uncharacterized protein LOC118458599 [Anopheles albimanus]|uniref:uncharacterized protein LOC118458599 n=1 Tax=Anopheles albimanus TaxID=7167 RepID=UPI001641DA0A|nr:uncharacterized protein LOC118458599 [Anopheles albimanus]
MEYNELAEILTKHFEPEPLEMMKLWSFRNRTQQKEESIKDYVQALLHEANDCGFGDHIQKAVRNQFVFGLRNGKTRLRLLQEKQLSLEKAKEIAMGMEAVEEEESKIMMKDAVEKVEIKISYPLKDYYKSYKPSIDTFIEDLLVNMSGYYEENNGRKSTWSFKIIDNYLYLTVVPNEEERKKKPGTSLRAIAY